MGDHMEKLGGKARVAGIILCYALVPGIRPLVQRAIMVDEWRLRFQAVGADGDVVDKIAAAVNEEASQHPYGSTEWVHLTTDRTIRAYYEAFCAGEIVEDA
jgi:hypothetical protein